MATVHREPNMVKWVGIRPGHNGEQVIEFASGANVQTTVYLVPATKLFLWYGWRLTIRGAAISTGQLEIWSAVPALKHTIIHIYTQANVAYSAGDRFDPPLELSAGESIRMITLAAGVVMNVGIDGILIDA